MEINSDRPFNLRLAHGQSQCELIITMQPKDEAHKNIKIIYGIYENTITCMQITHVLTTQKSHKNAISRFHTYIRGYWLRRCIE